MEIINVFISYAKNDFKIVEKLVTKDLKSKYFTRNGVRFKLNIWWDYHLTPSEEWKKQIIENIEDCDLFVCVLTNDFMSSKFIINTEIPLAKKRFEKVGIGILGILYEECNYKNLQIKNLQLIPQKNGRLKSISKWRPKKDALKLVINALKTASIVSYSKKPTLLKHTDFSYSKLDRKIHREQFLDKKEQHRRVVGDRLNRRISNARKKQTSFKFSRKDKRYMKFTGLLITLFFLIRLLIDIL